MAHPMLGPPESAHEEEEKASPMAGKCPLMLRLVAVHCFGYPRHSLSFNGGHFIGTSAASRYN